VEYGSVGGKVEEKQDGVQVQEYPLPQYVGHLEPV